LRTKPAIAVCLCAFFRSESSKKRSPWNEPRRLRVFAEFYRLGDESTREAAGTGLGLALVKKFAGAHNGFVEILSVKPTGAVFRVAIAAKR